MSRTRNPKVVIAGGGIGGLTAALALIRRGFPVEVYEAAPEPREVGAGVQVSSNGMLVLKELGVDKEILDLAAVPEKRLVRMWNTGQAWTALDISAISRTVYGNPYVTMYRPDLLAVLTDAVEAAAPGTIRYGRRAVGCAQEGREAVLHLADGSTVRGDALVGADGIHSSIRSTLHGADEAEFTGLVAWRGIIPMESLPPHIARQVSSNWVGPGRHVVQYPLRRGKLMNFVGVVERTDWQVESWTTPGTHEEMRADFVGWHEEIQTLISAIPQPFVWALKLRRPLPVWSAGNITLLGDACHPTLPFMAQGAVMAIEDGFILARALDSYGDDVEDAFSRYEEARRERTSRVVNGSADNTKRFHNPALGDPAVAQAYVETEFSEKRIRERFDWMYQYDATQAAI